MPLKCAPIPVPKLALRSGLANGHVLWQNVASCRPQVGEYSNPLNLMDKMLRLGFPRAD